MILRCALMSSFSYDPFSRHSRSVADSQFQKLSTFCSSLLSMSRSLSCNTTCSTPSSFHTPSLWLLCFVVRSTTRQHWTFAYPQDWQGSLWLLHEGHCPHRLCKVWCLLVSHLRQKLLCGLLHKTLHSMSS